MALANYSDIQASIASFLHRDDLNNEIPDFIRLAEADLQVRAKLSQWDTSTTVSLTSGVGALPADFAKALSVNYGSQENTLQHLESDRFAGYALANPSGEPFVFTIDGSSLKVAPGATGDATLRYTARFTPLSATATTNSLLDLFPDAYLNGSLMFAASWLSDDAAMQKYAALFEQAVGRVRKYFLDYKYPSGLQMRAS